MTDRANLLLIGMANAGKTHYGAQVYLRLDADSCGMQLLSSGSLEPFQATIDSLSDGRSGVRTPKKVMSQSSWKIRRKSDGMEFDLEWPDYAGETLGDLLKERRMPAEWQTRIEKADGWVLMIRASQIEYAYDVFTRQPLLADSGLDSRDDTQVMSLQAQIIEVLQMFVFRHRLSQPTSQFPPLAVMISCFDELPEQPKPDEFLTNHLPMLTAYISSNWGSGDWRAFGLSPLGKSLSEDKVDQEFVKEGPEKMGFVVDDLNESTPDLLSPLEWVIERVMS